MNEPVNPPSAVLPVLPAIPHDQSFIEYPCAFPIKVMGVNSAEFVAEVMAIVRQHDPVFDADLHLEQRPSSTGKYLSLTVTVNAIDRTQLDAIYRGVTGHPLVKYVL